MRLLRNTRTFVLATLLGTALLVKADRNNDYTTDKGDVSLDAADVDPQRGGPDPAMQEVCARR